MVRYVPSTTKVNWGRGVEEVGRVQDATPGYFHLLVDGLVFGVGGAIVDSPETE